jgi:glycosyltransferase involved in cell wall biosynthesis
MTEFATPGRPHIFVDALCVDVGGGSESYLLEVLHRLADYPVDLTVLVAAGLGSHLRDVLPRSITFVEAARWSGNPFGRSLFQRFWLRAALNARKPDVLWIPGGLTSFRKARGDDFKLVQVLRNMMPFNERERLRYSLRYDWYQRLRLFLLSKTIVRSLARADRTIFISDFSARTVAPLIHAREHHVVPHGLSRDFLEARPADDDWLRQHGIRRPFFLYVSRLDPYKNQDIILRACERYRDLTADRTVQLVFAGQAENSYARGILRAVGSLHPDAVYLGIVPRKQLPGLMAAASVLLFASTCETCPNILLEYLAVGRPVVTTTAPPMPEFAGDAALTVDAEDVEAWAHALARIMSDAGCREGLIRLAKERSRRFSWDDTVRKTYAVLTSWDIQGEPKLHTSSGDERVHIQATRGAV